MPKLAIILVSVFTLVGCETKEEKEKRLDKERLFSLQHTCIRKHGTPMVENDKFIRCEFTLKGILKKE